MRLALTVVRCLGVLLVLGFFASGTRLTASSSVELGLGLRYQRILKLPEDLPRKGEDKARAALILDIRGAQGDTLAATAFSAWLQFHCRADLPVFILTNQDTTTQLIRCVQATEYPALVTLAPLGVNFEPDITVDTSLDSDRSACQAIAQGEKLEALYSPSLEKERQDEEYLAKSYSSGARTPSREPEKQIVSPVKKETHNKPADLVLARAVQIHRALIALRKQP